VAVKQADQAPGQHAQQPGDEKDQRDAQRLRAEMG